MGLLRNIEKLIEKLGKLLIDLTATILQWLGSHLVLTAVIVVLLIFFVELYSDRS